MRRELLLLEEMIEAAEQAHLLAADQTAESLADPGHAAPAAPGLRPCGFISSINGRMSCPFTGIYNASKYAKGTAGRPGPKPLHICMAARTPSVAPQHGVPEERRHDPAPGKDPDRVADVN